MTPPPHRPVKLVSPRGSWPWPAGRKGLRCQNCGETVIVDMGALGEFVADERIVGHICEDCFKEVTK